MKKVLPLLGLLALPAQANDVAELMLCKTQGAIEDYVDKKYIKKEEFALPGCIFATAIFMPVEKVKVIRADGMEYEIWRVALVAQIVDEKAHTFLEAQERYAVRKGRIPGQDV